MKIDLRLGLEINRWRKESDEQPDSGQDMAANLGRDVDKENIDFDHVDP